jgi:hypothetical protein
MFSLKGTLLGQSDEQRDAGRDDNRNAQGKAVRRRNYAGDFVDSGSEHPHPERLDGTAFVAEQGYFSIRIVEMRLAEPSHYLQQVLPMCCCFLRYPYDDGVREVPYIISYETILKALGQDDVTRGGDRVEFRDIYIVQNAPVREGAVEMYAALCRVADSKFARGMLDLLSDTAGAIGGPAAGLIAGTGVSLTKRLAALLGADGVSTRFGLLDGNALRKSGYRVFAGADAAFMRDENLQMNDGKLYRKPPDGAAPEAISDIDYLVIAFEHRASLISENIEAISTRAFGKQWEEIMQKLAMRDDAGAQNARNQLMLHIATSPQLITRDRFALSLGCAALIDQWKEVMHGTGQRVRGASDGDIVAQIGNAASQQSSTDPRVRALLATAGGWLASQRLSAESGDVRGLSMDALARAVQNCGAEIDRVAKKLKRDAPGVIKDANTRLLAAALTSKL